MVSQYRRSSHSILPFLIWLLSSSGTSSLIAVRLPSSISISCRVRPSSTSTTHRNNKPSERRRTNTFITTHAAYRTALPSAVVNPESVSVSNHTTQSRSEPLTQSPKKNSRKTTTSVTAATPETNQSRQSTSPSSSPEIVVVPKLDLPRHIAFICDGNSRWAKSKSLPESMGHVAGADRVVSLIKTLQNYPSLKTSSASKMATAKPTILSKQHPHPSEPQNDDDNDDNSKQQPLKTSRQRIEYCTLFAFSTENWSRPSGEINALFKLMERTAVRYQKHDSIKKGEIRIKLLGDMDDERIPMGARRELRRLETVSGKNASERLGRIKENDNGDGDGVVGDGDGDGEDVDCNDVLTICLAINYGGRADILQATKSLAQSIIDGDLPPEALDDETELSKRLYTGSSHHNIPDPDLILRTGGEKRLSNFLLWNAAYAELYFCDALWPDFDDGALEEALVWYGDRKRRFGGR